MNTELAAKCWLAKEDVTRLQTKLASIDCEPAARKLGKQTCKIGQRTYVRYDSSTFQSITDPLEVLAWIRELEPLCLDCIHIQGKRDLTIVELKEAKAKHEDLVKQWESTL